jgi:probable rRNA maturation factor
LDFSIEDDLAAVWDEPPISALVTSIVRRHFRGGGAFAVTLHLVSDAHMRTLNAAHRGADSATDVLSFPLHDSARPDFVLPPNEPINLGDVVVSYPRALAQAEDFGHSPERELAYLVAHGVLHILGYDHETDGDRERMRYLEEEALGPLGLTR